MTGHSSGFHAELHNSTPVGWRFVAEFREGLVPALQRRDLARTAYGMTLPRGTPREF
jgi:hypothetical protein